MYMIVNHVYRPVDPLLILHSDGQGSRCTDSKFLDLSGNKNHGIITGATYKNAPSGKSVLNFNGTDNLIRIPVFSNYIRVDKNANNAIYFDDPTSNLYGRDHFYVMQFQARNFGGIPKSTGFDLPWTSVTQNAAISACDSIGGHLMTNNEWMAIARDAEQVAENWTGGAVGSGMLKRGNVGVVDDGSYDGGDPEAGILNAKAILKLSNGEEIYHFSGNVWEWTSDTVQGKDQPAGSSQGLSWWEFNELTTYGTLSYNKVRPANSAYISSQGAGKIYTDGTVSNTTVYAFRRGGRWSDGDFAGMFTLLLDATPTDFSTYIGFRCVLFD